MNIVKYTIFILFLLLPFQVLGQGYETEWEEVWFRNLGTESNNGNKMYGRLHRPKLDLYKGEKFPAVVYHVGGFGAGARGRDNLAEKGFVTLHFNVEGRGTGQPDNLRSEGEDNYAGYITQDDIKAAVEYIHSLPYVIDNNVGISTFSASIIAVSGCLARYPETEVKYWVEGEGPTDGYVVRLDAWLLDDDPSNDWFQRVPQSHREPGQRIHPSLQMDNSPENQLWWKEREAVNFMSQIRCYYMRVQAEYDHVQPPHAENKDIFFKPPLWYHNKHALDAINLATRGTSPWTRMNGPELGNPINAVYDYANPPEYYQGFMRDHPGKQEELVVLMSKMETLSPTVPEGLNIQKKDGDIQLSWNANPEEDIFCYEIYRSTSPERYNLKFIAAVNKARLFYLDSKEFIESGITYYYSVKAMNKKGCLSDYCDPVSIEN